jgi:hypothetical protein
MLWNQEGASHTHSLAFSSQATLHGLVRKPPRVTTSMVPRNLSVQQSCGVRSWCTHILFIFWDASEAGVLVSVLQQVRRDRECIAVLASVAQPDGVLELVVNAHHPLGMPVKKS